MRLSEVIKFLETVKNKEGDLRLETVTGFWVRTIPRTGETVVVCSVGNSQPLSELHSYK